MLLIMYSRELNLKPNLLRLQSHPEYFAPLKVSLWNRDNQRLCFVIVPSSFVFPSCILLGKFCSRERFYSS